MSRVFKDMYFKLFSVKPWSSFNVSGASQPQKWQWLSSCSAPSCPGVSLGTGGQILDSARALVNFDQLTDGWGADSQLQIWIFVICSLTSNWFFSVYLFCLCIFSPIFSLAVPHALQCPGCCSGSQCSGANTEPWKPLCSLQHTGNRVRKKKDLLAFIFQPTLCKFIAQREKNTESIRARNK